MTLTNIFEEPKYDNSNSNRNYNMDDSTTLKQGKLYKKYQKKIKKDKALEKSVKLVEGLATMSSSALIDISALNALESAFETDLSTYQSAQAQLLNTTNQYVNGPNVTKNVYVNNVINSANATYQGCYNDNAASPAMTLLSNNWYTFNQCKQAAMESGNQYFALQNTQASGVNANKSFCSVGNSLSSATQYGPAQNGNVTTVLWQSYTAQVGTVSVVVGIINGQLIMKNTTTPPVTLWTSNNYVAGCAYNGGINNINATYGGNCSAPNTVVSSGNATPYLSSAIGRANYSYTVGTGFTADPSPGCAKNFDITYQCGNVQQTGHIAAPAAGQTAPVMSLDCTNTVAQCVYYLILQDDGNMCLYQGVDPSHKMGTNAAWCSNTNGQAPNANPAMAASRNKFGRNYMKQGETMSPGEFLSSTNGSLVLSVYTNGNLALTTTTVYNSCMVNRSDGKTYGSEGVNALYKLDRNGTASSVGKLGYIDDNSRLSVYPNSMLTHGKNAGRYEMMKDTDSPSNDIGGITSSTMSSCQTACDSNPVCIGFVFDNVNNICYPKNSGMYATGASLPTTLGKPGVDLYYPQPTVNGDASCNLPIQNVDSVQWAAYTSSGNPMTSSTKCGLASALASKRDALNAAVATLSGDASAISGKITTLEGENVDVFNQMDDEQAELSASVQQYARTNNILNNPHKMDKVNGMLSNSDIAVLQENYHYMFWSILAIASIIITINVVRK